MVIVSHQSWHEEQFYTLREDLRKIQRKYKKRLSTYEGDIGYICCFIEKNISIDYRQSMKLEDGGINDQKANIFKNENIKGGNYGFRQK